MKNVLLVIVQIVALVLMIYFTGVHFAQYIVHNHMQEMPLWLYDLIRLALDHTGNSDIREPDDLSTIALLSVLSICWIAATLVVISFYFIVRKIIRMRCDV
ncbi:hypothetical protein K788_0002729 [Paraburkholderia caribensis MBA4]|uniref:Transmembrane protein n=1 Tax=Paraburkholderia caribensis MBA4 TaxID=1323664 RepID=A0A0P0RCT1_9BURK|nr:hypothetical protein [Paraburkholderia caribensis]ALL66206.1 hypothetical protein K788_0002729 [Paraburkholderia caribensis MBA4]